MNLALARQSSFPARLWIASLLTAAADFLLFDQVPGISLFIFVCLLAGAIVMVHSHRARKQALILTSLLLLIGLLPLIEDVSGLSVSVALFSVAAFALAVSGRLRARFVLSVEQILVFLLASPIRLARDFLRWRVTVKRLGSSTVKLAVFAVWLMPLILAVVFVSLFGLANPIIEHWLSLIDFWALVELIGIWRAVFWIAVLAGVWAFLRPRLPGQVRRLAWRPASRQMTTIEDLIFGKAAILRALLLFNALFAVQTFLDGAHLWGGVTLPEGVSYASYAHRGAYPLIATALLAALYVLVVMRPGSEPSTDHRIRLLVYVWIAQNVVLVVSSILQLDLYISIYSLTYWRVAALIWMVLVAAGLLLIMARIALEKSSEWLCAANFLTLFLTLYLCCFVNFAALIADYNIQHSKEAGGAGQQLDFYYLKSFGNAAFPAIDRAVAQGKLAGTPVLRQMLYMRAPPYTDPIRNWRDWTFRKWRLSRYLEQHPSAPILPVAIPNER